MPPVGANTLSYIYNRHEISSLKDESNERNTKEKETVVRHMLLTGYHGTSQALAHNIVETKQILIKCIKTRAF